METFLHGSRAEPVSLTPHGTRWGGAWSTRPLWPLGRRL